MIKAKMDVPANTLAGPSRKKIHIGRPIEMDDDWFMEKLMELELACNSETDRIRELVSEVVPTYTYQRADSEEETVSV